jgi:hypothetical protein
MKTSILTFKLNAFLTRKSTWVYDSVLHMMEKEGWLDFFFDTALVIQA